MRAARLADGAEPDPTFHHAPDPTFHCKRAGRGPHVRARPARPRTDLYERSTFPGGVFYVQAEGAAGTIVVLEPKVKVDLTKYVEEHKYAFDRASACPGLDSGSLVRFEQLRRYFRTLREVFLHT